MDHTIVIAHKSLIATDRTSASVLLRITVERGAEARSRSCAPRIETRYRNAPSVNLNAQGGRPETPYPVMSA